MSRVIALGAAWGAALANLMGCAPEITPVWKVDGVRDLASQIVVTHRGPLGDPLPDDPARPLHEALPFDTVRVTPLLVNTEGPVPTDDLEFRWVACDRIVCTEALLEFDELPPCDGTLELLGAGQTCAAGEGPTAEITLGAGEVELGTTALAAFVPTATLVGIGSVRGEPGAAECQRRLEERAPLGECFVLHQNVAVGPLSDFLDFIRLQGFTVETEDIPESILLRPRNLTPAVEQFSVEGLAETPGPTVVQMGSTLRVTPGTTLTVRYLPSDSDLEPFEVVASDGTALTGSDFLQGRWFATGDHESFDPIGRLSEVTLTLSAFEETSFLYFLVRDSAGSVNLGWLRLQARTSL